jgi:hypothetical protein
MSITYPEAQSSRASKSTTAPAVGGGSALFPGGAANLYDRARGTRSARGRKGMPIAWIAAPVAVVVVGGAIALSLPHPAAAPVLHAITTTTSTASRPLAQAAAPAPAAPVVQKPVSMQKTVTHTATLDAVRTTTARGGHASSARTVTLSANTETLPAGPVPYDPASSAQGGQPAVSPQAPQTAAPDPVAAPTPGDFVFTAPATGLNGAQPTPAAPGTASGNQPAPQAAAQPG